MRLLRLLVAVLLALAVLAAPAGAATVSATISVSSTAPVHPTAVTVSGRVRHVAKGTRAVLQRSLGDGWKSLRTIRTSSGGRWSARYVATLGQNHLRLVVPASRSFRKVVSRTVTVAAQLSTSPRTPVANEPVQVSGQLRTAASRPVELQVSEHGQLQTSTAGTNSAGVFSITTTLPGPASVRIVAPRAKVGSRTYDAFATPWRSIAVAPANLMSSVPTLSGVLAPSQVVQADPGTWTSGALLSYAWSVDGEPVPGATGQTYTIRPVDIGAHLRVTVTGTKSGYSATSRSSQETAPIAQGVLSLTPQPRVTGQAQVGASLIADKGTWDVGVELACQWLRDGAVIPGETGCSHVVTNADAGARLAVRVSGTKLGWAPAVQSSEQTEIVTGGTLSSAPVPSIAGEAVVEGQLVVSPGTWDTGASLAYQWRRDGGPIPGADGSTYVLVGADAGRRITVTVTGTKTGFVPTARTSAPTGTVAPGTLASAEPVVSGHAQPGGTVTVAPGEWGPGDVDLSYRWLRDDVPIPGATLPTYVLTDDDRGSLLAAEVTGSRAGYVSRTRISGLQAVSGPQSPSKIARALRTFHAALEDVDDEPLDIFVGPSDSLADGARATSIQKRWISVLRDDLRAVHQPAGVEGGFGYLDPYNWGQFPDNPISYEHGVGVFDQGLGRQTLALFDGTQTITVKDRFTDVDILYSGQSGAAGAFTYSVDGGTPTKVSTGGKPTTRGGYVERVSGLTPGQHEIVMRGAGGGQGNPAIVEGVMLYSGDRERGVRVWEGGASARRAFDYVAPEDAWATSLKEVHPDLVVLPVGSNDFALGVSAEDTEAKLREIIATIRSHVDTDPSIVLMPYYDRPTGGTGTWAAYREMYARIASTDPDIAVFDLAPFFGAFGSEQRQGIMAADLIHPSDAGYALIAQELTEFVTDTTE